MNPGTVRSILVSATLTLAGLSGPEPAWAASSTAGQKPAPAAQASADSPEDRVVTKYLRECEGKMPKDASCDRQRNDVVAILKEDLLTLGSTADRKYLPTIVRILGRREIDLRIAATHAIGMIGLEDGDLKLVMPYVNDPVPEVRQAVSNMLGRGKGKGLDLLKQRFIPMRTGRETERAVDPSKYPVPVAPGSVYLFDSSDASKGRLSYITRKKSDPLPFFKARARKGPYKWEQFRELYRFQLQDEEAALDQAQQAASRQLASKKPPDPANIQAFTEHMQNAVSVSMSGSAGRMYFDSYQANLFGAPTVYVLEERQIGQRKYPTRYVVLYQELALSRPGYRLAWTTVPDSALAAAQVTSLKEQREEEALKAATKREDEAAKKEQAELDALTQKKDAAEKKKFRKGQEDLEKELDF